MVATVQIMETFLISIRRLTTKQNEITPFRIFTTVNLTVYMLTLLYLMFLIRREDQSGQLPLCSSRLITPSSCMLKLTWIKCGHLQNTYLNLFLNTYFYNSVSRDIILHTISRATEDNYNCIGLLKKESPLNKEATSIW